jgi:hypothetical protein
MGGKIFLSIFIAAFEMNSPVGAAMPPFAIPSVDRVGLYQRGDLDGWVIPFFRRQAKPQPRSTPRNSELP